MSDTKRTKKDAGEDGSKERLRGLAAVDEVLREPAVVALLERYPRELVVRAVRTVIERLRAEILEGGREAAAAVATSRPPHLAPWVEAAGRGGRHALAAPRDQRDRRRRAHQPRPRACCRRGGGRAVATAAVGYTDLEYDLARGERATRQDHVHDVLCAVTGAEDALAVNNNAAAVLLALAATARGGEVIVSRGQLVEIGDGFRIPDILRRERRRAGRGRHHQPHLPARLRGRLERAHARRAARAHEQLPDRRASRPSRRSRSSRRSPTSAARVLDRRPRQRRAGRPAAVRRGAVAGRSVAAGADLVTFSGDKLLGGPQAGIVVGRAAAVARLRAIRWRARVRIDKLDLAALDAVLRLYLDPSRAVERIPTLALLVRPREDARRARRLRDGCARRSACRPSECRLGRPRRRRRAAGRRGGEPRRGRSRRAPTAPTRLAGRCAAARRPCSATSTTTGCCSTCAPSATTSSPTSPPPCARPSPRPEPRRVRARPV